MNKRTPPSPPHVVLRAGWRLWRRAAHPPIATGAAPAARPRLIARLFGGKHGAANGTSDATLLLARDWLVARDGHVTRLTMDVLEGTLADGAHVRYTCSPLRAHQEPGLLLLSPGMPAFEALQRDIAERARGVALRIGPSLAPASTLARAAFVAPPSDCEACLEAASLPGASNVPPPCPLHHGQFVAVGAGPVRHAVIERETERVTFEYTFRLSVASSGERREELLRVALDAATGERLPTVDEGQLHVAQAADPATLAPAGSAGPSDHLTRAETLLEPAAQAAARLARAQALASYQRRLDDIATTFSRLLLETPEDAPAVLAAREHALRQLAESHAVEWNTQLVALATIVSPQAEARIHFASGVEARVTVDLSRATVAPPSCDVCGAPWRISARCAEGHLTCLACQRRCAHCGRRQCARCAATALAACAVCDADSCAACARATARGRHRLRHAASTPLSTPNNGLSATLDESVGPDDLRVADLDAMTPATWRACLSWLLGTQGFTIERELVGGDDAGDANEPAFVCRAATATARSARFGAVVAPMAPVVVLGHRRPVAGAQGQLSPADVKRLQARASQIAGARTLLVTTGANGTEGAQTGKGGAGPEIVDRSQLARWLADQRMALREGRDAVETGMDQRAQAAIQVRQTLQDGLRAVAALLDTTAARHHPPHAEAVTDATLTEQGQTARQALAALDTLIEEWEGAFPTTPSRSGAQDIAVDEQGFGALGARADHLLAVLDASCVRVAAANGAGTGREWITAVRDELREMCLALATRCQALDPAAWRAFDAVRDTAVARASVEHLAAAKRAGARGRRLRDALDALAARSHAG